MSSKVCDADSSYESARSQTREEQFNACWERCFLWVVNGPRGNRRFLQKLWADVGTYLSYVKSRREQREQRLLAEEWAAARGLPPPPVGIGVVRPVARSNGGSATAKPKPQPRKRQ